LSSGDSLKDLRNVLEQEIEEVKELVNQMSK